MDQERFRKLTKKGLIDVYAYFRRPHPEPLFIDVYEPTPFLSLKQFLVFFMENAELWVRGKPSAPSDCVVLHDVQSDHALANVDFTFSDTLASTPFAVDGAVRETLCQMAKAHHLTRLQSVVLSSSAEKMNALESLGFQKEGVFREHYFFNGQVRDVVAYAWMTEGRRGEG